MSTCHCPPDLARDRPAVCPWCREEALARVAPRLQGLPFLSLQRRELLIAAS